MDIKGKLQIRRLAVNRDNQLIRTSEIVWEVSNLTDVNLNTTFGGLSCNWYATCFVNATLTPGEIYELVLYSFSFMMYASDNTKHYLFGDSTITSGVQEKYAHLFFVRDWDIYAPSNGVVSSRSSFLELSGTHLKYSEDLRA